MKATYVVIALLFLVGCGKGHTNGCTSAPGSGTAVTAPQSVYVFAGQSNIMGHGRTSEIPESDRGEIPNVYGWTGIRWETYKPSIEFGPDLYFARAWSAAHPTETVGIVKCGVSDSSLFAWVNTVKYWLEASYVASGSPHVNSFIWYQGETDAAQGTTDYYRDNLPVFLSEMQARYSPSVIMGLTRNDAYQTTALIQQAQIVTAGALGIRLVQTSDLTLYADMVHLDTNGQRVFGGRILDTGG